MSKDVTVKIYKDMLDKNVNSDSQFLGYPGYHFQKLIIAKGCHNIVHYEECEQCKSDDDYLFLHFSITGSADICIGKVEK